MKYVTVLILTALLSCTARASEPSQLTFINSEELRSYFEVAEVTVTEDARDFSPEELAYTGFKISNGTANDAGHRESGIADLLIGLGIDIGDVNQWITVGLKIWEVIKANQPVANVQSRTVSVLPLSQPNWQQMETWKGPQAKSYTIAAKNLYGATVVSHKYTVAFHYGGSIDGHGQFLANATIIPTQVSVSWGFTLNSDVKVGEPLNTGTKLNPIPGIGLALEWDMGSALSKRLGRDHFYVRGDGSTSHVNEF